MASLRPASVLLLLMSSVLEVDPTVNVIVAGVVATVVLPASAYDSTDVSEATLAKDSMLLIEYVAVDVAPEFVAVTLLVSELEATSDLWEATDPKLLRLAASLSAAEARFPTSIFF